MCVSCHAVNDSTTVPTARQFRQLDTSLDPNPHSMREVAHIEREGQEDGGHGGDDEDLTLCDEKAAGRRFRK